jgi:branched-chain amino acid transport system permease protein
VTTLGETVGSGAAGPSPAAPSRARRAARARRRAGWAGAIVALVVFVARVGADPSGAVLWQAAVSGLLLGGVYGLVAMGLTLIFGVLEIVNFAHGALMAVGLYVAYTLVRSGGVPVYVALPVTVAALLILGAAIQRALIAPAMGQPLENQLLLTLGLAILIENALQLAFTATPKTLSTELEGTTLGIFGATADLTRVIAFGGALALAAVLYGLLHRTRLGTAIRAVASNPRGAALVGVDVRRLQTLTFAIGTACVGAAAGLVVPFLSLQPTSGETFNILAFVTVVLGGLGSVAGALVGGLLIGLTQEVGGVLFPAQSSLLGVFIVFLLVLFLRPQGLFGSRTA